MGNGVCVLKGRAPRHMAELGVSFSSPTEELCALWQKHMAF